LSDAAMSVAPCWGAWEMASAAEVLFCLQQPAGLARLASHFHLRPQMKVAKAKGLNTI
jgi:hypothetical protein